MRSTRGEIDPAKAPTNPRVRGGRPAHREPLLQEGQPADLEPVRRSNPDPARWRAATPGTSSRGWTARWSRSAAWPGCSSPLASGTRRRRGGPVPASARRTRETRRRRCGGDGRRHGGVETPIGDKGARRQGGEPTRTRLDRRVPCWATLPRRWHHASKSRGGVQARVNAGSPVPRTELDAERPTSCCRPWPSACTAVPRRGAGDGETRGGAGHKRGPRRQAPPRRA